MEPFCFSLQTSHQALEDLELFQISTKYVDMIHLVNKLVTPSYSSATLPIIPGKLTLRTYSVNMGEFGRRVTRIRKLPRSCHQGVDCIKVGIS
ncbi:uncharacterized protein [Miscanthus floridulus]|uniref:uncharacterized protein isoform X2 n=1 Tax=Miscanthus floridulus TaxID=154761 RepID=UPI0034593450